jgi:hypothetical protein
MSLPTRTESKSWKAWSIRIRIAQASRQPQTHHSTEKTRIEKSKREKGGRKGHKAYKQQVLEPNKTRLVKPNSCTCGHAQFDQQQMMPFYTHQHIELPEIEMDVTHYILHQCECSNCGKTVKGQIRKSDALTERKKEQLITFGHLSYPRQLHQIILPECAA